MSIKINQNIFSLLVRRNLDRTSTQLEGSYERLSSGERINRAADDPSGLATSTQLRYEILGLRQTQQNISSAMGLVGVAESELSSMVQSIQRMRELTVQAANETLNANDRTLIQAEINQILEELDRIATNAKFNDQKLLDGSLQNVKIQAGTLASDTLTVSLGDFRTTALGARSEAVSTTGVSTATLGPGTVRINNIDIPASSGDGISTLFPAGSATAKAAAINEVEVKTGVHAEVVPAQFTGLGPVSAVNLDGAPNSLEINGIAIHPVNVSALDATGTLVDAINARENITGVSARTDASGVLVLEAADGRNIQLTTTGSVADDLGLRAPGDNGDVTDMIIGGRVRLTSTENFTLSDPAGEIGFGVPLTTVNADPATAVGNITVGTTEEANDALRTLDTALSMMSDGRASLGAFYNRLESLNGMLARKSEDYQAADSLIRDTDFAYETARLTQSQVLEEAAIAMLAQANITPQRALELLRGS